ncbi:MAG: hypothetical protein IJA10_09735 [Lachnospiraceae bacterium]|nr:hypothetical protein [Lachnospiraceae bacterium]
MFDESIPNEYRTHIVGGSKGTQIKYLKDNMWYKEDNLGCEGDIEYLVSIILRYSSLQESSYVVYEKGKINNKNGCRSKDFTSNGGYVYYTLQRLYEQITGLDLYEKVKSIDGFEERRDFVLEFFNKYYKFDLFDYFSEIFTLDLITLNEDRHFNNLGILLDVNSGEFCNAPIFDNGMSLLNGNVSVSRYKSIEENVRRVTSKPFSGSPLRQYNLFSHSFFLDYIGLFKELNKVSIEDNFYKDVLCYQLLRYKDKFFKYELLHLKHNEVLVGTRIQSCGNTYDVKKVYNKNVNNCVELRHIGNEYICDEGISTGVRIQEIPIDIIENLIDE